jgi:hypothetical protein
MIRTFKPDAPSCLSERMSALAARMRNHGAAVYSAELVALAREAARIEASLARATHRLDEIAGVAYDLAREPPENVFIFRAAKAPEKT